METVFIPHAVLSQWLITNPEGTLRAVSARLGGARCRFDPAWSPPGQTTLLRVVRVEGLADPEGAELTNSFAHSGPVWTIPMTPEGR